MDCISFLQQRETVTAGIKEMLPAVPVRDVFKIWEQDDEEDGVLDLKDTTKVAITGSRRITDSSVVYELLDMAVEELNDETSGDFIFLLENSLGVASIARRYAEEHRIPFVVFKTGWARLVGMCDVLVAIRDGKCETAEIAAKLGLIYRKKVILYVVGDIWQLRFDEEDA